MRPRLTLLARGGGLCGRSGAEIPRRGFSRQRLLLSANAGKRAILPGGQRQTCYNRLHATYDIIGIIGIFGFDSR